MYAPPFHLLVLAYAKTIGSKELKTIVFEDLKPAGAKEFGLKLSIDTDTDSAEYGEVRLINRE